MNEEHIFVICVVPINRFTGRNIMASLYAASALHNLLLMARRGSLGVHFLPPGPKNTISSDYADSQSIMQMNVQSRLLQ